jgi:hypothetical protein
MVRLSNSKVEAISSWSTAPAKQQQVFATRLAGEDLRQPAVVNRSSL